MVKTLVVLILLFNGTLVEEEIKFDKPVTILECLEFANKHRDDIATHFWMKDVIKSGYYLNNKQGTVQGFICK
jgi:hypothetical protein|tara:strand:- start:306 stop:524 length:219 start_codon:yes stop_codon:yes gene_type:complete